ncbi:hypothetical protein T492DRAFT_866431 [Pavlovales sp. CCMP2436]|nr:hypothetical protein T492DRAFT_866431 [Pavlovales sp. CCMP2436]
MFGIRNTARWALSSAFLVATALVGVSTKLPEALLELGESPAQYDVVLAALRSVLFLGAAEAAAAVASAHGSGSSVVLASSFAACAAATSELRKYGLRVDGIGLDKAAAEERAGLNVEVRADLSKFALAEKLTLDDL